ncbi:coproporphyrinogen III oxidase [Cereibacter changlensis JA139]|uniref:Heme chaperone HemW n=2 Tax=Cereibacter changlensis TaxID=402884 RepID=A0A2T4K121_9RHOB|nr:radical SAM family heme chaperone HemW [Cereibacter changlensis]PTE23793.1 coproporphyrinogen III oxidase [Cereibacter changlensis JA139]PZX58995.1 oxygen-independent coproporphyrinogen-3 oxidase [Cereibacter changlensis]
MEDWKNGGFGLYLHWPFCQSKCPYCDFNSHVAANIDQKRWQRAYLAEIDRIGAETPGRLLNSVFFGGGTPSLMEPELVAAILERVRGTWVQANDLEVTLEANPGSVEAGRFRGYREAGVNRVSMGIQSLNDADLRKLGRLHTVSEARAAFDVARQTFDRVSFDLIYARQDQSLSDWEHELGEALSMAADHLSMYQLTVEEGTAFGDRFKRGKLRGLPEEDTSADMYQRTQEICEAAGLPAYEVSNHAAKGSESRHNLIYWRAGDYAGIGPGAHGRLTLDGVRLATEAPKPPGDWLQRVERDGTGELPRGAIDRSEQALEYLMMALRLREGLDLTRYERLAGSPVDARKVTDLEEIGMVEVSADRVRATAAGRMVLNSVIADLAGD